MASAAFLTVTFDNTVSITVVADESSWTASDPHAVLQEDEGKWTYGATTGTILNGATQTQLALVNWRLSAAKKGEEGVAYRFPQNQNEVGSFVVDRVLP